MIAPGSVESAAAIEVVGFAVVGEEPIVAGLADECVAAGAAMGLADAVQYARAQIQLAQRDLDREP